MVNPHRVATTIGMHDEVRTLAERLMIDGRGHRSVSFYPDDLNELGMWLLDTSLCQYVLIDYFD